MITIACITEESLKKAAEESKFFSKDAKPLIVFCEKRDSCIKKRGEYIGASIRPGCLSYYDFHSQMRLEVLIEDLLTISFLNCYDDIYIRLKETEKTLGEILTKAKATQSVIERS